MLLLSTGEFDPLRSYSLLDPECSTFLYWFYYVYIPVPLIVLFLLVWSMWKLQELISDAKPGMLNVVLLSRENEGMHHLTALMQHYHL